MALFTFLRTFMPRQMLRGDNSRPRASHVMAAVSLLGFMIPVGALAQSPSIAVQPQSTARLAGTAVVIAVSASGAAPLNYYWIKDGSPMANGAGVSGSQTASLQLANVQEVNSGGYSVVVSNSLGSVTSSSAVLTVWRSFGVSID